MQSLVIIQVLVDLSKSHGFVVMVDKGANDGIFDIMTPQLVYASKSRINAMQVSW